MKIPNSYNKLEEFIYNRTRKTFRRNSHTWYLKECNRCGCEYFGYKDSQYCSKSCIKPMLGKTLPESAKEKIRLKWKDHNSTYNNKDYRKLLSQCGNKNNNWKGGVTNSKLPLYNTYAHQLEWAEEVRRYPNNNEVLEVKCFKCGKWFTPNRNVISNRLQYLKGNEDYHGMFNFYCSNTCKNSCSIYGKTPETLMREDAIRAGRLRWLELNREVQPELRQMVLERDNYECVKCGSDGPLHCHHILPVAIEPMESADIDNCITLCQKCHKEVHKLPGCSYNEIRIEVC
jgi:hypothetical protein